MSIPQAEASPQTVAAGDGSVAPATNLDQVRSLFEDNPVPNLLLGADFRIEQANRAVCALLGYERDELIGRDPALLMHPDEVEAGLRLRAKLASGALASAESDRRMIRRDGQPVWVRMTVRAWTLGEDTRHYVLVLEDSTARRAAAERLEQALRRSRTLLETMSVGVAQVLDGCIVLANREFARVFGYAETETVGLALDELTRDRANRLPQEVSVLPAPRPGETASGEVVLFGKDGTPVWCLVQARLVEGEGSAGVSDAIYTFHDVSELKRQREALARSLLELNVVLDATAAAVLHIADGRVTRGNAQSAQLFGGEASGPVGRAFEDLFEDSGALSALGSGWRLAHRPSSQTFEARMRGADGRRFWGLVSLRAVDAENPNAAQIASILDISERRRQEQRVATLAAESQLLFDTAVVGLLFVRDGKPMRANAALEEMLGAERGTMTNEGELRGHPADELLMSNLAQHYDQIGEHGACAFEMRLYRRNGNPGWVAVQGRAVGPRDGSAGYIFAFVDIDARKRSEADLRDTLAELQRVRNYLDLIVESLPVLVSVREAESGRFISLNRAGEAITGMPRERVIGQGWKDLYDAAQADMFADLDRAALDSGRLVDRPRDVLPRADGRTLTVHQRVLPLYESEPGADGRTEDEARARYVMSIVDDITDAVRAEAMLKETDARFRQLAENIDELVFIATDDFGKILYVSPRYEALIGAPLTEALDDSRSVLERVHPADVPMLNRRLPRLIAQMRRGRKAEITLRFDHPERGLRTLLVRLTPVRMFDGAIRVFGIADDISERVAAEARRLDEALKQRDLLVREVHHRIKNNLQGVAGLLQHQASAKPELAETLNEIAGQIQAIASVHGMQLRASGTLPVLGVVQGIFNNLGTMFGAKVNFEAPSPSLWRWGLQEHEAVPLALVINELGTNAIKYRSSREQGIAVRMLARPDGVEVRVENPGRLADGFDLARIASGVSGLALVKALLPRRGARLSIEPLGPIVISRLVLVAPAIREEPAT